MTEFKIDLPESDSIILSFGTDSLDLSVSLGDTIINKRMHLTTKGKSVIIPITFGEKSLNLNLNCYKKTVWIG